MCGADRDSEIDRQVLWMKELACAVSGEEQGVVSVHLHKFAAWAAHNFALLTCEHPLTYLKREANMIVVNQIAVSGCCQTGWRQLIFTPLPSFTKNLWNTQRYPESRPLLPSFASIGSRFLAIEL